MTTISAADRLRYSPPKETTTESTTTEPYVDPGAQSCLWTKGVQGECIDGYADPEYDNAWAGEEWSITQYEGDDRYYVYNHKDELEGYLRRTPWGWRAMVMACPTNPPKGWSRQGCGWVRAGKAVKVSHNVYPAYRVHRHGKVVGTARGPDAVGVVAYELIESFDHEQYWKDGE
jgi:hypothetical protein